MARSLTFVPNEYYHLYNRGVDKRRIFLNRNDYNRFVALLYACNAPDAVDIARHFEYKHSLSSLFLTPRTETLVDIISYCLMPNHFHILALEKKDGGISLFMKKLSTAYTMHFNKKLKRTGSLFEGSFKARYIDSEPYLQYVISYIHLNPVKLIDPEWKTAGIKNPGAASTYLATYEYSSLLDYTGTQRREGVILNMNEFPEGARRNSIEDTALKWIPENREG